MKEIVCFNNNQQLQLLPSINYIWNTYGKPNKYRKAIKIIKENCSNQLSYLKENFINDFYLTFQKQLPQREEDRFIMGLCNVIKYKNKIFKDKYWVVPKMYNYNRDEKDDMCFYWIDSLGQQKLRIDLPISLSEYKEKIPIWALNRISKFENLEIIKDSNLKNDLEFKYFVADVKYKVDPILLLNIGGIDDFNVFLGAWE